ncbi:GNAT family N-acetyltransferase [Actomonas aquatica]|uniref:GNAT family N-acetyltransferase n=1 Tax=Actomonas aquatica TaxID=2866162 RepID=A0ABZ1CD06_9BACT|nr:GNAT family N-acetyltransferase [Opitutus sp. WL0086]WRQ88185.1 GNAT family N-acetyltransferase [Opitutus sp. WL0086]
MDSLQLRPFISADIDAALTLWRATPGIGLTSSDEPDQLRQFLQRNPGCSFVAIDASESLAGTVLCGHDGRRGFLYHLAVAPAHRRHGLGRLLAETALGRLRRNGITRVTAHVYAANDEGKAFWASTHWRERVDLVAFQQDLC